MPFIENTNARRPAKKLTDKEREIITRLGDELYTPEFVEEQINGNTRVDVNAIVAMQECSAEGFYRAVKRMAVLEESEA